MLGYSNRLFSFDVGSNSIGWCVFDVDDKKIPVKIVNMGVRIFSDGRDPQSKTSLAVARREARGASRRRDRYVRRREQTLALLTEYGLMPVSEQERKQLLRETNDLPLGSDGARLDPYNLRLRALTDPLSLSHIGRALFHLGQRRGFKSNRKADRKDNEDKGKIALGVEGLRSLMAGAKAETLGVYLAKRRNDGHVVRIRAGSEAFNDKDYVFYPERSMLVEEFNLIWDRQAAYHRDILTPERKDALFKVMFFQRPLKTPLVSRCSYHKDETRLPKAHPLFQEFRLYKEVNELGVVGGDMQSRKLSKDERDQAITLLRAKKKLGFATLRKTLKLHSDERFNKESDSRKDIVGDEVYATFSDKKAFGPQWAAFSLEKQWEIIDQLRNEEDPARLESWLKERFTLDQEQLAKIMNAPLPEGHGRLGMTAMSNMLDELKHDVIPEAEAAKRCGYDHTLFDSEATGFDTLPPYQEVLERQIPPGTGNPDDPYDIEKGRITNPTVHIGLNQLRRVVNALIRRYGKPVEMAIELARELSLSDDDRKKVNKAIADNTRAAEARSKILAERNVPDNGYNRQLLKLWEELHEKPEARVCIYSGEPIGVEVLFSGQVDIDHILPWSRTLDDSQANKILCLKEKNRVKRNRAPAEVTEWQNDYDDILARAAALPKGKRWRFARGAMEEFEKNGGFLARQLADTQYLSRMALSYLSSLYPAEEPDQHGELRRRLHVRVVPGKLTEMLRRNWGLNSLLPDHNLHNASQPKNRQDHRHHAIDAAVVGVTSRSMLQHISTMAGQAEANDVENFIKRTVADNPPWSRFRADMQDAVNRIIVSHKPDHGTVSRAGYAIGKGKTAAKLHNDTAYGLTGERDAKGNPIVVRRKPFLSLQAKDIANIRDVDLQRELYSALNGLEDKDFAKALLDFTKSHPRYQGIRRVRMVENLKVISIHDKNGKAYKGVKGDSNYRYDVWQTLDGKWNSDIVSMYDIHQPGWVSPVHAAHPTAKKVLSLQQNDMVAYEHPDDGYTIARVVKFSQGNVMLAPHQEANVDQRNRDHNDYFKYYIKAAGALKNIKFRQVRIDEVGQVFDAGFKW